MMYSTDNGAEKFTWPDDGTAPFRGEKNDNWEGGYRVPLLVRWPGAIAPGTEVNEDISHEDWFPTLAAATGDDDIADCRDRAKELGHKFVDINFALEFISDLPPQ
jgi:arylsulfatase